MAARKGAGVYQSVGAFMQSQAREFLATIPNLD